MLYFSISFSKSSRNNYLKTLFTKALIFRFLLFFVFAFTSIRNSKDKLILLC